MISEGRFFHSLEFFFSFIFSFFHFSFFKINVFFFFFSFFLSNFAKLCHDETPMVRRAAASNLKGVVKELSKKDALKDGVAMFNDLAADEHV